MYVLIYVVLLFTIFLIFQYIGAGSLEITTIGENRAYIFHIVYLAKPVLIGPKFV